MIKQTFILVLLHNITGCSQRRRYQRRGSASLKRTGRDQQSSMAGAHWWREWWRWVETISLSPLQAGTNDEPQSEKTCVALVCFSDLSEMKGVWNWGGFFSEGRCQLVHSTHARRTPLCFLGLQLLNFFFRIYDHIFWIKWVLIFFRILKIILQLYLMKLQLSMFLHCTQIMIILREYIFRYYHCKYNKNESSGCKIWCRCHK